MQTNLFCIVFTYTVFSIFLPIFIDIYISITSLYLQVKLQMDLPRGLDSVSPPTAPCVSQGGCHRPNEHTRHREIVFGDGDVRSDVSPGHTAASLKPRSPYVQTGIKAVSTSPGREHGGGRQGPSRLWNHAEPTELESVSL